MKKVGIYSGTFDPVHNGHVAFALEAAEQIGLEKVFFLPEPKPRRKQGVKAFEHRAEMVRLAIADYGQLGLIILEQQRFTTRQTLPILAERFKGAELYMLLGDDMLDHFVEWPEVEDLISNISFIIGLRKYNELHIKNIADTVKDLKGLNLRFVTFKPTEFDLSSTQIKKNIKKSGDYSGLDPEVTDYINNNRLYSVGEK